MYFAGKVTVKAYLHMYSDISLHPYVYIYTPTYMYVYIHICMYIYTYLCISQDQEGRPTRVLS